MTPTVKQNLINNIDKVSESMLKEYIKKGTIDNPLELSDHPAVFNKVMNVYRAIPQPSEQAQWQRISAMQSQTSEEINAKIAALNEYVAAWSELLPANNNVETAKQTITELGNIIQSRALEEFGDPHTKTLDELFNFIDTSNLQVYSAVDEVIWNKISELSSIDEARKYLKRYIGYKPQLKKHQKDAEDALQQIATWDKEKNNEIIAVINFQEEHAGDLFTPLQNEIDKTIQAKKAALLSEIRAYRNLYPQDLFRKIMNAKLFTMEELLHAGVFANQVMYDNYINPPVLPDLENTAGNGSDMLNTEKDHTDVYFFGIPGTGKTCVLAGIVSENKLFEFNTILAGYSYGNTLRQYITNGIAPAQTKDYVVSLMGKIPDKGKEHPITLVEMSGEKFKNKIAYDPQGIFTFEDMASDNNEATTALIDMLNNNNRKIFFLVIDHTQRADSDAVLCYERMIDMFDHKSNANVMRHVDAIHIIMTKSDLLEGKDPVAVFNEKGYDNHLERLIKLCNRYGINKADDGHPRLIPFSLGDFYVGNMLHYNSKSSTNILKIIRNNTVAIRDENFMDRFRNWLNS